MAIPGTKRRSVYASAKPQSYGRAVRALPLILVGFFLTTFSTPPSRLAQVLHIGELDVVTRNSSTTFFTGPDGPQGFEYELASLFAEHLGVALNIYVPGNFSVMLDSVADGRADLAAAGLTVTEERSERFRFGPAYLDVTPQVIYRMGNRRPRSLADMVDGKFVVMANTRHTELLREFAPDYPGLTWTEDPDADSEELLFRVQNGEIDYTVADSTEFNISRYYYPEIRLAFDLGDPEPVAWAFRPGFDDSLYRASLPFFDELKSSGRLAQLIERAYGHATEFDYVGTRRFLEHIDSRLPRYQEYFIEAARSTGVDWRLLAAIGYQESHWNPRAVSPTGVRGIMMLTQSTARMLGIEDRVNPRQSIMGGARYLVRMRRRIPERITEPDRTWMALASYNVGFGHLEDARILTESQGGNPDRWADVRQRLPLLAQKKYYSKLKRGYARGWEPVIYVDNIRSYYDVLQWATSDRYLAYSQEPPDDEDSSAAEADQEPEN